MASYCPRAWPPQQAKPANRKGYGETKAKLTGDEERFIKEAASGGLMEVVLGQTATEKAASEQYSAQMRPTITKPMNG